MILSYILLAILIINLISLIGIFTLSIKDILLKKYLIILVAISAGLLIGNSFFHLIPESFDLLNDSKTISIYILLGILFFYLVEKYIHWHHHHDINCHKHTITKLTLIGDGFHNFVDGILIAGAFLIDFNIGIITTISIIFHEIPQEISDFSLLLHGGFSKIKALIFNFLSGSIAFIGGLFGYFLLSENTQILPFFLAFTAGNFIYLSLVDILPELDKKKKERKYLELYFLFGIFISFFLFFHHH